MHLAEAARDGLSQLRVVGRRECRVFLVNLVQPCRHFVFLPTLDRSHGQSDVRRREANPLEKQVGAFGAQRIAGVGIPQLGHDADVAGMQLRDLGPLSALRDAGVSELFRRGSTRVVDRIAGVDNAREDPEVAELANVRFRGGFEDEGSQRPVIGRRQLDRLVTGLRRFGDGIGRAGHELDEPLHQASGAEPFLGRSADHREDEPRLHRLLQRLRRPGRLDGLLLEILLHQLLIGGGDGFHQLLIGCRYGALQLGGGVLELVLPVLRPGIADARPAGKQVHHPANALSRADRDLEGHGVFRELLANLGQRRVEVRVLLVDHRNDEDTRNAPLLAEVPDVLRPHQHPARGVDQDDGAVGHAHTSRRFAREVEIAGCVDQVDLRARPLSVRDRYVDRDTAIFLLGSEVSDRRALAHRALAIRGTGREADGIEQRGFPRAAVPQKHHVADVVGAKRLG